MTRPLYSVYSRLKVRRQKFANVDLVLKDSVVYPWYELLSNADGLWSVFLPLSAHKLMNEIADESLGLANPI